MPRKEKQALSKCTIKPDPGAPKTVNSDPRKFLELARDWITRERWVDIIESMYEQAVAGNVTAADFIRKLIIPNVLLNSAPMPKEVPDQIAEVIKRVMEGSATPAQATGFVRLLQIGTLYQEIGKGTLTHAQFVELLAKPVIDGPA